METTQNIQDPIKDQPVHFCDYEWDGQLHLLCLKPWAIHKSTPKELLALGIKNTDYGYCTLDTSKVTCNACKARIQSKGDN